MIQVHSASANNVMHFICDLADENPVEAFAALGQYDGLEMTAGVIYHGQTLCDIGASIAVSPKHKLSRRFVCAMFHFPFIEMSKRRITVCIRPSNSKSQNLARKLGFKYEGMKRKAYPDGEDMLIFGMLKEECKWLQIARRYGH